MTSCKPSFGDIWLAYVEFADCPGVGKVRPVVVLDVQDDTCIVVAAKVTSQNLIDRGNKHCISIENWNECGLRKPSYIRLDQKLELAFENLLRDAPLGTLSEKYMGILVERFLS